MKVSLKKQYKLRLRWVKLLGKCAIEMGNKEDKEDLFVVATFAFAKVSEKLREAKAAIF